jgi:hypothetical protein
VLIGCRWGSEKNVKWVICTPTDNEIYDWKFFYVHDYSVQIWTQSFNWIACSSTKILFWRGRGGGGLSLLQPPHIHTYTHFHTHIHLYLNKNMVQVFPKTWGCGCRWEFDIDHLPTPTSFTRTPINQFHIKSKYTSSITKLNTFSRFHADATTFIFYS